MTYALPPINFIEIINSTTTNKHFSEKMISKPVIYELNLTVRSRTFFGFSSELNKFTKLTQ